MARANNTNDNHNEMIITQIINNNFKGERGSAERRGEGRGGKECRNEIRFRVFTISFLFLFSDSVDNNRCN